MCTESLSTTFAEIQKKLSLSPYLEEICISIYNKNISKGLVENYLTEYNVNKSLAKVDFIHLIFEYIKVALEDNVLTVEEREDVKYLKQIFSIQPGEIYFHSKANVESTIACQMTRIYEDSYVTEEEALLKVDLQEVFDISFDQMNEFAKIEAGISIQKGADPKNLDIFFTHKEYFEIRGNSKYSL